MSSVENIPPSPSEEAINDADCMSLSKEDESDKMAVNTAGRLCSRCALDLKLKQRRDPNDDDDDESDDYLVCNPPRNLAVMAWRDIKLGRRRQLRLRARQPVVHYPDNRSTRLVNRALGQGEDTIMRKLIQKMRHLGVRMRAVKVRPRGQ